MALEDFKEALGLLRTLPVLWIPGVVAGLLTACLWIVLDTSGTFFASRLVILFALVVLVFVTGMLAVIKKGEGSIRTLVTEGVRYYFRVLLPLVVVVFVVTMIILVIMMAATLAIGGTPDMSLLAVISLCILIPAFLLTLFTDTAAVFEDCRVFASIKRSVTLASSHAGEVIRFFLVCVATCFIVIFGLMIVWEAALYSKLEPLTAYNETQMAAFTPEQFMTLVGHDGIWVTAVVSFVGVLILLPVLMTYKTCFFKKIAGSVPVIIQQQAGEYDSKGRWYKY